MDFFVDKPSSIAEAAAGGFLKVPGVKEPDTSEQQAGAGLSIADAAKTGFLKVPAVGENKGQLVCSLLLQYSVDRVEKCLCISRSFTGSRSKTIATL